ncbi:BGTF surface domain-containing protein [Natronomonas sp.]|uniref:BGTF surface domain-containing protein n=1 Tax=Natronomonas sp. TaxID=2184060 RepID=UPI002FC2CD58
MTWRRLLVFAAAVAVGLGAVHGAVGLGTIISAQEDPAETPRLVYEGETLELDAAEDQTIRGQTDLDEGEEVTVRLKSSGSSPFLMQQTATVDDEGAFEATFDLSGVMDNQSFETTVVHDDEELLNETGEVHATDDDGDDGNGEESDDTVFETNDDGTIELAAAEGQVVRGQTDLEPGTEVTVRLRSSSENPFLMQRQVTIEEDGSFEAAFDLSNVEPGSPFEARLRADGEVIDDASGEVTE